MNYRKDLSFTPVPKASYLIIHGRVWSRVLRLDLIVPVKSKKGRAQLGNPVAPSCVIKKGSSNGLSRVFHVVQVKDLE